ncbi:polysaccharide deacetylase family protein [Hymenobacter terricola]|uniref:polysaccharide deacetylase family protein n=1 Tax=Hymenobacter terricola TaxID=2819236 RepID=UPI001CF22A63|nr:polysaccharide deacetylase family protein [Hymenobacter terricola]
MPMRARLDAALLTRPPRLLHALLPGCEWTGPRHTPAGAPVLYLTFDDGPIPEETPWVLEQLALYNAQATFFCVGQNLERYPEIARAALAAGHRLGNHTHYHRSAWASARAEYLDGIADCQTVLAEVGVDPAGAAGAQKRLFRPPYGRLTWSLLQALRPEFRLVMWSVLTRDYDPDLSPENCLQFTLAAVRPGDILVFHDSRKASARLRFVLPRVLAHFVERGYQFSTL